MSAIFGNRVATISFMNAGIAGMFLDIYRLEKDMQLYEQYGESYLIAKICTESLIKNITEITEKTSLFLGIGAAASGFVVGIAGMICSADTGGFSYCITVECATVLATTAAAAFAVNVVCCNVSKNAGEHLEIDKGRLEEASKSISSKLKSRIDDIRSKMPNTNLSKRGNMAAAETDIPGVKREYVAHSKINSAVDKGSDVAEFSYLKPEDQRIFTSYVDDGFPRYHDTEAKILEDIASQIKDPNVSGTINLYSELPCCQSCTNIKLNVFVGK